MTPLAPRCGAADFAKASKRAQGRAAESDALSPDGGNTSKFGESFTGP